MVEIRRLNAHDPVPAGRHVVVLRRFDAEDPHKTVTDIMVTHRTGLPETARPDLDMPAILEAAKRVAQEEGIAVVQVIDRTAGPRERDVMQHGGDRSIHGEQLKDDDLEEGEPGPDMRDRGTHDPN
jgi:hypothetical protein